MKLLFKAIFIFPFLIIWSLSQGQSADTSHLRISLLTCGPADELYSIWGHSAIRVKDSASGMDVVFNYGTFDKRNEDKDYRSTLYWNPNVNILPGKRQITLTFYNNDASDFFRVVIEGMSTDGKLTHFDQIME